MNAKPKLATSLEVSYFWPKASKCNSTLTHLIKVPQTQLLVNPILGGKKGVRLWRTNSGKMGTHQLRSQFTAAYSAPNKTTE
eukprot:1143655-Pelagomonas_calceolata.AAC.5